MTWYVLLSVSQSHAHEQCHHRRNYPRLHSFGKRCINLDQTKGVSSTSQQQGARLLLRLHGLTTVASSTSIFRSRNVPNGTPPMGWNAPQLFRFNNFHTCMDLFSDLNSILWWGCPPNRLRAHSLRPVKAVSVLIWSLARPISFSYDLPHDLLWRKVAFSDQNALLKVKQISFSGMESYQGFGKPRPMDCDRSCVYAWVAFHVTFIIGNWVGCITQLTRAALRLLETLHWIFKVVFSTSFSHLASLERGNRYPVW